MNYPARVSVQDTEVTDAHWLLAGVYGMTV